MRKKGAVTADLGMSLKNFLTDRGVHCISTLAETNLATRVGFLALLLGANQAEVLSGLLSMEEAVETSENGRLILPLAAVIRLSYWSSAVWKLNCASDQRPPLFIR